jgi:hypothetical protein
VKKLTAAVKVQVLKERGDQFNENIPNK